MSDFLGSLASRVLKPAEAILPRLAGRFELVRPAVSPAAGLQTSIRGSETSTGTGPSEVVKHEILGELLYEARPSMVGISLASASSEGPSPRPSADRVESLEIGSPQNAEGLLDNNASQPAVIKLEEVLKPSPTVARESSLGSSLREVVRPASVQPILRGQPDREGSLRSAEGPSDPSPVGIAFRPIVTEPRGPAFPKEESHSGPETTVHVTIGRIEVRAIPAPPVKRRRAPSPPMSLEEYLRRRTKDLVR